MKQHASARAHRRAHLAPRARNAAPMARTWLLALMLGAPTALARACARGRTPGRPAGGLPQGWTRRGELPNVLYAVPGLGDIVRARNVLHNVRDLRARACIVFTQLRCGDDPAMDALLDHNATSPFQLAGCEVVRSPQRPGSGYAVHVKRLLPTLVEVAGFDWVFFVLDDVALPTSYFSLRRFVAIAEYNNLTLATPSVYNAHFEANHPRNLSMMTRGCVGRRLLRFEFFALAFRPSVWRCFYNMMDPEINSIGWGYDSWLSGYCDPANRMLTTGSSRGVVPTFGVIDEQSGIHGDGGWLTRTATEWNQTYSYHQARNEYRAMQLQFGARKVSGRSAPIEAGSLSRHDACVDDMCPVRDPAPPPGREIRAISSQATYSYSGNTLPTAVRHA